MEVFVTPSFGARGGNAYWLKGVVEEDDIRVRSLCKTECAVLREMLRHFRRSR